MRIPRLRRRAWSVVIVASVVVVLIAAIAGVSPWLPSRRPGPPVPLGEVVKVAIRDAVVAVNPSLRRRRDLLRRQAMIRAREDYEARRRAERKARSEAGAPPMGPPGD